ncbi:PaaI thioesterase [Apodospora peruviana]|uniref:PaaI thioesterase n=1 Tax=Apodospora peruviana TaxID=516989 RepID=A0AAE0M2M3_9PEZI|nr:PaaI thioesterase [Apodospora peruviana]
MPTKALPPLSFVRTVLKSFMAESGLEPRLFDKHIRVTNAVKGKVDFELDITKYHTNRLNIIHGGAIASMVDFGGSLAVASMGLYQTGVTTDLNVTYLRSGGKVGDTIRATAECDKMGKIMAYTEIKFYNQQDQLVARGSHSKFVRDAWKHVTEPFAPPEGVAVEQGGEPEVTEAK